MQRHVITDPDCVLPEAAQKSKTKTRMGLRESAAYLASSSYIRNLALLVRDTEGGWGVGKGIGRNAGSQKGRSGAGGAKSRDGRLRGRGVAGVQA
jgi:hypothetical protein